MRKKISEVFGRNPWLALFIILLLMMMVGVPLLFYLERLPLIDAFFITTSAETVTGLWSSVTTLSEFSRFGQIVVLVLVQLGGLAAMAAGVFLLLFLRGVLFKKAMQGILDRDVLREVKPFIYSILGYTFFIEAIGAGLYFIRFSQELPLGEAIFYSIFHSVSSFCNAGVTLFSDSFIRYQGDALINFVTMALIVLGGLGFVVLIALKSRIFTFLFRRGKEGFDFHTRIVLISTVFLILVGFLVFFSFDAIHLNLSWQDGTLASLFQSVTTRTGGFNTVNIGALAAPTLFCLIMLMFIGAGPLSTSGGIKVTTAFLGLLLVRGMLRGEKEVEIWKHRIPQETLWRSMAIIIVSFIILGFFSFVLLITENIEFSKILFEITSAFGTVGLSTGITPTLSILGKLSIALVMLFGRLGPLTLVYLMSKKIVPREVPYPENRSVIVG